MKKKSEVDFDLKNLRFIRKTTKDDGPRHKFSKLGIAILTFCSFSIIVAATINFRGDIKVWVEYYWSNKTVIERRVGP